MSHWILFCLTLLFFSSCSVSPYQATLSITVNAGRDTDSQTIGIRGNKPPLSWDQSLPLTRSAETGQFTGIIRIPLSRAEEPLAYKLIRNDSAWELESFYNRRVLLKSGEVTELNLIFDSVNTRSLAGTLPADLLIKDLNILDQSLRAFHPGLFLHQPESIYQQRLEEFKAKVMNGSTPLEFLELNSRFLSRIQCSHTFQNPYNQQPEWSKYFQRETPVLPFYFQWIEDQMVITAAMDSIKLPRGTRINQINGIAVESLLDSLLLFTRGDGMAMGKRIVQTEIGHGSQPTLTDHFLPFIVLPDTGFWAIEGIDPAGKSFKTNLPVTNFESRNRSLPADAASDWSFYLTADRTAAILNLPTFVVWKDGFKWKQWLDSAFTTIRLAGIENLIIDIRQNEGGADEVIAELSSWILKRPFSWMPDGESRVSYRTVPDSLRPWLSTWDPAFYDRGNSVETVKGESFLKLKRRSAPLLLEPKQNAFNGTVWLLTGPQNSSATHHLARLWKKEKLAVLVGEETGGSLSGSTGGQFFFLHLPHSGVEVDIPLILSLPNNPETGGVKPDYEVRQTVNDFLSGSDPAIQFILEKIKR